MIPLGSRTLGMLWFEQDSYLPLSESRCKVPEDALRSVSDEQTPCDGAHLKRGLASWGGSCLPCSRLLFLFDTHPLYEDFRTSLSLLR